MYKEETSSVTSMLSFGKVAECWSNNCRKCVVSLMYEGMFLTCLIRWVSMKPDIFSVGHPLALKVGLPGTPFLCILGKI